MPNSISLPVPFTSSRGCGPCCLFDPEAPAPTSCTVLCIAISCYTNAEEQCQVRREAGYHVDYVQVAELESSMQSAASRHADDLDETRRGYEDRLSALRSELEQQEVDKAALLDIAQVPHLLFLCLCAKSVGLCGNRPVICSGLSQQTCMRLCVCMHVVSRYLSVSAWCLFEPLPVLAPVYDSSSV